MEQGNTLEVRKIAEWNRLVNNDPKGLFKSLSEILISALNTDFGDAIKSSLDLVLGIASKENDELSHRAYVLIQSALRQALLEIVLDSSDIFLRYTGVKYEAVDFEKLGEKLDKKLAEQTLEIRYSFFNFPDQFPFLADFRPLFEAWMIGLKIPKAPALAIGRRLRFYFVRKLNEVWKKEEKYFEPLRQELKEEFQLARVRGRYNYNQSLIENWYDRVFDEAFGLDAIYVELNACYPLPKNENERTIHKVVDSEKQIWDWLHNPKADFKTLVLRGGPGSGKSSLMKRLGMRLANESERPVYFVPLQWFDFQSGFENGIKRFVEQDAFLSMDEDPFKKDYAGLACQPIFIFDGLDELSRAGGLGQAIAQEFIVQLKSTFSALNNRKDWDVRAIVTGRDLVVQQVAEPGHKNEGQVLELLPYSVLKEDKLHRNSENTWSRYQFKDEQNLLNEDLRIKWWKGFWQAKGDKKQTMPKGLKNEAYDELSCQPLLSYLLARAFADGLIDSDTEANINTVYERLVDSLRERPWRGKGGFKHTILEKPDFFELLEELAVTAWHTGDVRVTNQVLFEKRCEKLGLNHLIEGFEESNQGKATDLVIAFFAKGKGKDKHGVELIEFTHKSFGEYLVARKLVRASEKVAKHYAAKDPDLKGIAAKRWLELCAKEEVTEYIWAFIEREVGLRFDGKKKEAGEVQKRLVSLFSEFITGGFKMNLLEDEKTNLDIIRASRNVESSLLLTISAFARVSGAPTKIGWRDAAHPKRVLSRLMLGRHSLYSKALFGCVFPKGTDMVSMNLAYSNLVNSIFEDCIFNYAILYDATLAGAKIINSHFYHGNLNEADLSDTIFRASNFEYAWLHNSNFENADAKGLVFNKAEMERAFFKNAKLQECQFVHADLSSANLESANLTGANFSSANLSSARLINTVLTKAIFKLAILSGTNLSNADLSGADLTGANLAGAILLNVDLQDATIYPFKLGDKIMQGQEAYDYLVNAGAIKESIPKP